MTIKSPLVLRNCPVLLVLSGFVIIHQAKITGAGDDHVQPDALALFKTKQIASITPLTAPYGAALVATLICFSKQTIY
ncbi:MAG: hypothetical protein ACFFEF_08065 [Candidatus Thorarchaeota archaeon]